MKEVNLVRTYDSDAGTFGLVHYEGHRCKSLELPWRNNVRTISCIPAGEYICRQIRSPKFGRIYGVFDVPGRSNVLIHSGNFAGDTLQGYDTHVQGCILLYERDGFLVNRHGKLQKAGLVSRPAVSKLMSWAAGQPFRLTITEFFGAPNG